MDRPGFSTPPPRFRAATNRCSQLVAGVVLIVVVLMMPSIALAEDYTVAPGDTLSVIARDHQVATRELAEANGISNLHLIRVGQVLSIPRPEPVRYKVQPGDTLSEIAASVGVSTAQIVVLNGLGDANVIRVGQLLLVPSGASQAAPDPAEAYPSLPSKLLANPERLALIPIFEKWSTHYNVPTDLLMAVAYRESGWQQDVVSSKGAIGIGQIMPRTAEWLANDLIQIPGLDPNNADDNIRMSARFLSWLIGYMSSVEAAIAGYYQGPTSVNRIGYYDDTTAYVDNIAQIRGRFRANR